MGGGQLFGDPDGRSLADDLLGQPFLLLVRFEREQDLRVPDGNPVVLEKGLDVRVEVEKAHGVGDRGPAFSHAFGDVLLREPEVAGEPLVGRGFLNRVEPFALEIFNQGEFEDLPVAGFADDGGSLGETEFPGGPPAAFPGDELIPAINFAHDERLDDSAFPDALDQFVEMLCGEFDTRLKRAWDNEVEPQLLHPFAQFLRGRRVDDARVDQRAESLAECLLCHNCDQPKHSLPSPTSRRSGFRRGC